MKLVEVGSYVLVRSPDAGVFAGTFAENEGNAVRLTGVRWLWYWDGAATLAQLSQEGVGLPAQCKFPVEVPEMVILGVCQVVPATQMARASIAAVPVWRFNS
jgi:hypothetical protein